MDEAPAEPPAGDAETSGGGPSNRTVAVQRAARLRVRRNRTALSPHVQRFEAYQTMLERTVELRILPDDAPEENRACFTRELDELLVLDHPAFSAVLDHGTGGGRAYYLVPYRPSLPLPKIMKEEPRFDLAERCKAARTLASALACAHAGGILLGPPAPVTLTWDPESRGLRYVHHRAPERVKRLPLGRSPPEDVTPEAEENFAADVFHWAAFVYWMLTGKPAWTESWPPTPIRERVPRLERELAHAIDGSLAREPALRPSHGGELDAILQAHPADLVEEEAIPVDVSGTLSSEMISESLEKLRAAGKLPPPVSRRRPRETLPEGSPAEIVLQESRVWRLAAVVMGCLFLVTLALLLRSRAELDDLRLAGAEAGTEARPPGSRRPRDAASYRADPYVRVLLRKDAVTPESFPRIHAIAARLARQGRLPPPADDPARLEAIAATFAEDPATGCRDLRFFLDDLRAATEAAPKKGAP